MVRQDKPTGPMIGQHATHQYGIEGTIGAWPSMVARRASPTDRLGADGRDILAQTVKQSVIPRLVAMPWIGLPGVERPAARTLEDADVARMLSLCLDMDGQLAAALVAELHVDGVSAELIYTGLLTPVARALGEMWEQDEVNFAEVTIGLLRLQNAQRALAPDFVGQDTRASTAAPRILLMPVPGDQHTFGLSMVRDFFRRAGWDAWMGAVADTAAALAVVRRERADVVGLSFACDDQVETAMTLIAAIREAAGNKGLVVLVGGPAFVADPALAAKIGADGTALDGHQAVLLAHELVHKSVHGPVHGAAHARHGAEAGVA